MGVRNENSTDYEHPDEPNLLNLHKAMQYNSNGEPELRTVSAITGNIIIEGDVNIPGNIQVFSTPEDPVHSHITEIGTSGILEVPFMPIQGNVIITSGNLNANVSGSNVTIDNTTFEVTQGTDPWKISGNVQANITGGNISVTGNIAGITSMPEIEIKNDSGNPIPISKNTSTNSSTNPIYVTSEGSIVTVAQSDVAVTAFDEPLSIGITPVIQADAMYGLDSDFWVTTELNNGNVEVTTDTTWKVQSGTSAGGYARLATAKYMTYQPGQGSMFRWTAAFTTANGANTKSAFGIDNIVQNSGAIDREDGYSFGYSGSTANDASRRIGILHRYAGRAETRSLTITVAPTGSQTATITLNGVAYTVSITAPPNGGGVFYTANQIANALKAIPALNNTWDLEGCNGVVTFTYYSPGAKSGTYSFSSSGTGTLAAGTFSQVYAGATPQDTWTYVDSWDNQTIQFDPSKLNVFGVDFRWLGAGRVRFFMEDPATGKMVLVHTQLWAGQHLVPHLNKPSLRLTYRSGTTNPAITPSQNVIVSGSSVFGGIQGMINQTGSSQAWYNIDSTTRAKDIVWHLISLQNPLVRGSNVNKASIIIQTLTVAAQGNDPSVVYIVKNAKGLSDVLVFQSIPNNTNAMFVQYSASLLSENLAADRVNNVQTLGINGTAQFDLIPYNLSLSPGETVSVFISSSNALNRTAAGITWKVD